MGGPCAVGDVGPGGGTVFYDAGTTQSWGRYLEAAPTDYQVNDSCAKKLRGVALMALVQGQWLQRSAPEKPTQPRSLQSAQRLVLLLMSPTNTPQVRLVQVNGSCHPKMN